eukprot:235334-Hanusia_phi.AAC.1
MSHSACTGASVLIAMGEVCECDRRYPALRRGAAKAELDGQTTLSRLASTLRTRNLPDRPTAAHGPCQRTRAGSKVRSRSAPRAGACVRTARTARRRAARGWAGT